MTVLLGFTFSNAIGTELETVWSKSKPMYLEPPFEVYISIYAGVIVRLSDGQFISSGGSKINIGQITDGVRSRRFRPRIASRLVCQRKIKREDNVGPISICWLVFWTAVGPQIETIKAYIFRIP